MRGCLRVVGLGPGAATQVTPQAADALADATDLVGYQTYLDRVAPSAHQRRHASDNREELDRARHALTLAADGARVAVVSSGDPGVFAMAAAVFEAVEAGPQHWRAIDIQVIPGITAMMAAAARIGAPLGHDFCAISLSDNLKPWTLVLQRLDAAATAGFVIALYNPASKARPWQLDAAFNALRLRLPGTTPVMFATAVGRADEHIDVVDLSVADGNRADMRTLVIVGSCHTRRIARPHGADWLYSPRGVPEDCA